MPIVAAHEPIRARGYSRTNESGGDRLPLPHLLQKERGTCVVALITQITRPFRFHVASILGASLATDDEFNRRRAQARAGGQAAQAMVRQTANAHGRVHARV